MKKKTQSLDPTRETDVIITFMIRGLTTHDEAREMGLAIAEHVLDTFNDDETIVPVFGVQVGAQARKPATEKGTRP